jgi:hypothetical protein
MQRSALKLAAAAGVGFGVGVPTGYLGTVALWSLAGVTMHTETTVEGKDGRTVVETHEYRWGTHIQPPASNGTEKTE